VLSCTPEKELCSVKLGKVCLSECGICRKARLTFVQNLKDTKLPGRLNAQRSWVTKFKFGIYYIVEFSE